MAENQDEVSDLIDQLLALYPLLRSAHQAVVSDQAQISQLTAQISKLQTDFAPPPFPPNVEAQLQSLEAESSSAIAQFESDLAARTQLLIQRKGLDEALESFLPL